MLTDLGHIVVQVLLLLLWDFVQPPLRTGIGHIIIATTLNAQQFANVSQQACNVGALVRCANTLQPTTTSLMPGKRGKARGGRGGKGRGD